jgi:hypothetical protein
VSTPESVSQWYANFYDLCRVGIVKPLECIQEPGDLLFVPSTWWHSVLNLEESVAVTQNFVDERNVFRVNKFVKSKSNKGLYNTLRSKIKQQFPHVDALLTEKEQQR